MRGNLTILGRKRGGRGGGERRRKGRIFGRKRGGRRSGWSSWRGGGGRVGRGEGKERTRQASQTILNDFPTW